MHSTLKPKNQTQKKIKKNINNVKEDYTKK